MENERFQNLTVPVIISETSGISRIDGEPISVGIPLCQGAIVSVDDLILVDRGGESIPCQKRVLALWPDNSVKWFLLDFTVGLEAGEQIVLELQKSTATSQQGHSSVNSIQQVDRKGVLSVDTGAGLLQIDGSSKFLFKWTSPKENKKQKMSSYCEGVLTDLQGKKLIPKIDNVSSVETGPLKTVVNVSGSFLTTEAEKFCLFDYRITLFSGKSCVVVQGTLHNPKPSVHSGGLWDLGDPASIFFSDFRLETSVKTDGRSHVIFSADGYEFKNHIISDSMEIYQESSGGENWQSTNHFNKDMEVPLSFNGYKVFKDGIEIETGRRASPIVGATDTNGNEIVCGIRKFWQNFPKGLSVTKEGLSIKLFPDNYPDMYELQGGEQKTHIIHLDFGATTQSIASFSAWLHSPLQITISPEWYEQTKVIGFFHLSPWSKCGVVDAWVKNVIDGPDNFLQQREVIDEYGWRNFGDIFANHEILEQISQPDSLVTHYNNQYDILQSALVQFFRTSDRRWFELASDLADHIVDIDTYHTDDDRVDFNNGLFWHTNHFLDAATATHRAMSREHLKGNESSYGGGPSLEHNYVSGLITYHYLTGNELSKKTALGIGKLVLNRLYGSNIFMENIEKLLRGLIYRFREKYSNNMALESYNMHNGPGRGSGNSLNVLLDVYDLSGDSEYLKSAERIIGACIHPNDNIEGRCLLNAEFRWTYTIFLQALVKYIITKSLLNEKDKMFFYAIACLNVYALWMVEHEYPFLDAPDKLDAPNFATRSAQELRKVNIFLCAAHFTSNDKDAERFREKAKFFFDRTLSDLKKYPTRMSARPMAVLLQNGGLYSYFENRHSLRTELNIEKPENLSFGKAHGDSISFFLSLRLPTLFSSLIHLSVKNEFSWLKRRYYELRGVKGSCI